MRSIVSWKSVSMSWYMPHCCQVRTPSAASAAHAAATAHRRVPAVIADANPDATGTMIPRLAVY